MSGYSWDSTDDGCIDAPHTRRNRDVIRDVLREALPDSEGVDPRPLALEIASGTGQHIVHFAQGLDHIDWQPSDPEPDLRASVTAWSRRLAPPDGLANLRKPRAIAAGAPDWGIADDDRARLCAVVNINMIHVTPWETACGIVAGAGRLLTTGSVLYLYGPYKRDGRHTAPSNEAFDASLRGRNPEWGIRDVADIAALAEQHGMGLERTVEMPANNLSLIFRMG